MLSTPSWRIRLKACVDLGDQTAEFIPLGVNKHSHFNVFLPVLGINLCILISVINTRFQLDAPGWCSVVLFPSRKGRRGSINILFSRGPHVWGAVRAHCQVSSACHLGIHVPEHLFIDFCFHQLSRWCSRACEKKPPVRKTRAKMAEVPWYLVLCAPSVWAVALFNEECHRSQR